MMDFKSLLDKRIEEEKAIFNSANKTLIHLLRENYDRLEVLFPHLKSRGAPCYLVVQELLKECGKTSSVEVIRQAMAKVREERSGTAPRKSRQPKDAHMAMGREVFPPDSPITNRPVLSAGTEGRPALLSGNAPGLAWSMVLNERNRYDVLFGGHAVPYKNVGVAQAIMPLCTQLYSTGNKAALLEALNFLKVYMSTWTNMTASGEGLLMKTRNWPLAESNLVESLQGDIRKLG